MTRDNKGPEAYVREVTAGTLSYVNALQQELSGQRDLVAELEAERDRLRAEVTDLRAGAGVRSADLASEFTRIAQQNANLANLYVASYRLHETVERDEVLAVIHEILANLVGSEESGTFELDPAGGRLRLVGSVGIDAAHYQTRSIGDGLIGRTARTGEMFVGGGAVERAADEADLTACVPLILQGKVSGVIAVFKLLGHKPALTTVDEELFELLATHAATALYCAHLHTRLVGERAAGGAA